MAGETVREGQILAGKYRVERVLGQGGMGVVVAAFHLELDQRVAVKFLQPEVAERGEAMVRFRREARALAKIRSEHVARVLDVGTSEDGGAYIVMEYLDGNDLAAEMSRRGQLPVTEAIDYVLQASEAIAEAHAAGIVHRDLKPANIFLARRPDGSRLAKVLDFGISKSVDPRGSSEGALTRTSTLMGSPLYMSPEQMRSTRDVDARTDIWSIGVILYEALTAKAPHLGETIPQICTAVLHDEPIPPTQIRPDLPPDLERVILRCLAKDRAARWSTVGELANALTAHALPRSFVHAQRANRVLGVSDNAPVTVVGVAPAISDPSWSALSARAVIAVEGTAASAHDGNASHGETEMMSAVVARPAAPVEPTLSSWGKTGPGKPAPVGDAPAPTRRGNWIWLSGAAVVLALGALFALAKKPARPEVGAAPAAVVPAESVAPAALAAPAPTIAVTVAPVASVAAVAEVPPAPSASAALAPAVLVAPVVGPIPSSKGHGAIAAPNAPHHEPQNHAVSGPVAAPKGDGISDFGGRR